MSDWQAYIVSVLCWERGCYRAWSVEAKRSSMPECYIQFLLRSSAFYSVYSLLRYHAIKSKRFLAMKQLLNMFSDAAHVVQPSRKLSLCGKCLVQVQFGFGFSHVTVFHRNATLYTYQHIIAYREDKEFHFIEYQIQSDEFDGIYHALIHQDVLCSSCDSFAPGINFYETGDTIYRC